MPTPKSHNVNWVASNLCEQRSQQGEASPREVTIGGSSVGVPAEFRRLYGAQFKNVLTDRFVAERMILEKGDEVEYSTPEEAEQAKLGIAAGYPDWKLEVVSRDGLAFLRKIGGISTRQEDMLTPPLKRVPKTTFKDANFADATKKMLEDATPNTPIILGTQTTGNYLTALKGADGTFKIMESSGKKVVRTLFGVASLEIAAEPPASARVKWDSGDYFIREAFLVDAPDVTDNIQLDYESLYSNPGHAQWLLNDSGMGARFGTQSAGNHVDVIKLNGNTWATRRTIGGTVQPMETVQNLVLTGDALEGVGVRGMRWEYKAKEVVALTSLEGTLHQ
ncbi:hypothetical protein HZA42_00170 [Candidatus Peregrinibacteria bacterium]|nr:hypothetical protein [Candidatus Peregrinibacteria bacterium]